MFKTLLGLVFIFVSSSAFAKITLFSSADALGTVLESQELVTAASLLPSDYELASVHVSQTGSAPNTAFQITLEYAPKIAPPPGIHAQCIIEAQLQSQIIKTGPGGTITASQLSSPIVSSPACAK